jgi:hypothetical protein
MEELSAMARLKSMRSASRSFDSSTWCSRSHTPARCRAFNRRQQLERDHPFQAADKPLPAVARALVTGFVFGPEADCSMRTRTPPFVGVSVQVTTVFSPLAASSPKAFQL